jgi:hypothetical protein
MNLIEELEQLPFKQSKNAKGQSLVSIILSKLKTEERESLSKVLRNPNVSSATISELLSKYGHEVSPDTIRRYRVRLKRNESN